MFFLINLTGSKLNLNINNLFQQLKFGLTGFSSISCQFQTNTTNIRNKFFKHFSKQSKSTKSQQHESLLVFSWCAADKKNSSQKSSYAEEVNVILISKISVVRHGNEGKKVVLMSNLFCFSIKQDVVRERAHEMNVQCSIEFSH